MTRRRAGAALLLAMLAGCAAEPRPPADFLVLFAGQSTALDARAETILDMAARAAGDRRVSVEGYTDPTGSPQANQILSRLRAQAVAEALVRRGVERRRVRLRPRRAVGGDPGVESRRVRIVIGR